MHVCVICTGMHVVCDVWDADWRTGQGVEHVKKQKTKHFFLAICQYVTLVSIVPSDDFKHGRRHQSDLNTWLTKTYQLCSLPSYEWLCWLLPDASPINYVTATLYLLRFTNNISLSDKKSPKTNMFPFPEKFDAFIKYRCFATTGLQHLWAMHPQTRFPLRCVQEESLQSFSTLLTPPTLTRATT